MSLNIAKIHSYTFTVDKGTFLEQIKSWLSFKVITVFILSSSAGYIFQRQIEVGDNE